MSSPLEEPPGLDPQKEPPATLRRWAARGVVIRLATQLFVWVSTMLIARLLLPIDYGLMSIGLIMIGLADMFTEAGIGGALIQKKDLQTADLNEAFTLNLMLSLVMYAILYVSAGLVADFYENRELMLFVRVLGIHALLIPFVTVPMALLDRSLSMGTQSAIHFTTSVLQSVVVLALAYWGLGYWALVAGSLGRRVVEVVTYLICTGWRPRLAWPGQRARGLLHFGIHITLAYLTWYIYSSSDFAFVGKFSGTEILGFYALAFQIVSLPSEKLTANVNKVAYPTFCRLQDDRPRFRDWFLRLQVLLGFIGLPMMVGMALVAEDGLIVILGEKWQPAVLPFQLLSLSGLFRMYSSLYNMIFNALGRPDVNFKFNLFCMLFFLPCYYAAAWFWGMIGVCLVWMVVFPIVFMALIHLSRSVTDVGLLDWLATQRTLIVTTAFMAIMVLAVQMTVQDAPRLTRLVLAIATGVFAYAAPMLLFCRDTVLADFFRLLRELRGQA